MNGFAQRFKVEAVNKKLQKSHEESKTKREAQEKQTKAVAIRIRNLEDDMNDLDMQLAVEEVQQ